MSDQEYLDYFLLEIIANIKNEYYNLPSGNDTEEQYIIGKLHKIAEHIVKLPETSSNYVVQPVRRGVRR